MWLLLIVCSLSVATRILSEPVPSALLKAVILPKISQALHLIVWVTPQK